MLSNRFYSLIPHAFGRNRPPVIASEAQLKAEIDLMDSLGDLKEAAAIMKAERPKDTVHQFDRQYAALGMEEMSALDHSTAEFKNIAQYLVESKGDTHQANYRVEEIFRIERKGEHDRFDQGEYAKLKNKDKNRRLLWHGSRSTNFGGEFGCW
jgi:poly [ADP-ribose] polymerase